ncbi:MobB family molybdopterin-guanine dinucleotide biosynthesis protein [Hafnia paralvei ATCC 29927]|jgi:molybdopterin-guanine dinucleotide biosynthesis adapter protein|uniref:Molybdopterin-guanine dinucleotide biosynthesis protein MobB n=2 Tax=Enterobacterales TaxID=91347 RepID=A0A2A2MDD5_9GAMM|nr:molybdopterin-guanine dinucleotide biosynthesis protein MobB [Hafnia paralvei]EFV38894.1 molybdopterin-guanine dinucleotide biosynthesis protein B [Enterobacteriaceae bacterium 9_2_54FAA]MDU1194061.1 molybdopterin-guanine dinucleotide biosynthesis protein MobB [Enterobacteriaceae bacterium]AMH17413.1 molybdopterin-guanine dinucleotide biosynthesis protein B [Hafnia paralvei]KHS48018.1 molybdopterin-guanine dinucleotide biosynthesis protein B [Hafnia paralvei]MBU2673407.1 molybdopterin-guani
MKTQIPLLGIAAYSGTGKTTLLKKLIPQLNARGIRIALIKHTHHDMDVDTPGKDSYELRKAGAEQTLVASDKRWALMTETPEQKPLDLQFLASKIDPERCDLILVEGFKHEAISKIALYRASVGKPFTGIIDKHVLVLASDGHVDCDIPQLDINKTEKIADFIEQWLKQLKP